MTPRLRAIVIGSAAGGGVPQWNCRCRVCRLAWRGDGAVRPRTQSSLAVSVDGDRWLLLNASPDIREQIRATPALHPREGLRHSPVGAVLVTNADVDHVTGLLGLRERQAFDLFGTAGTLDTLAGNPIFAVMAADLVARRPVRLGEAFEPLPGLAVELFAVPGKVPLWLEDGTPAIGVEGETTVGVTLRAAGRRIVHVPGCAAVTDDLRARIAGADALFFDGTLFTDDEMIREGLGAKTGRRMGHVSMAGPNGSAALLAEVPVGRRVYVHINNTNPVLIEGSPERAAMAEAGWEIAHDGLEVTL